MKIKVEIASKPQSQKLLSRREILKVDGIYKCEYPHLRFVINAGKCFTFGDGNPLYISGENDMDSPKYVKVDEKILFTPI